MKRCKQQAWHLQLLSKITNFTVTCSCVKIESHHVQYDIISQSHLLLTDFFTKLVIKNFLLDFSRKKRKN